ncbi:MAG: phosphoenolpyruvate-protein phosphotransferase [Candidatus Omnitrophota bacterium]|jgi:phosphoenolpyruvate-protein phosphotransferase
MVKLGRDKKLGIIGEAKFMHEKAFDIRLLEIFTHERPGTSDEREQLKRITLELGDSIYIEAVYLLTHKIIKDSCRAKAIYSEVINHRDSLTQQLARFVSIQVAALDYSQNVLNLLRHPTIMEESKIDELAKEVVKDQKTGAFDSSLLDKDLKLEGERFRRYHTPCSLIFGDIDDFKKINDRYGHAVGDQVLKKIGDIFGKHLRKLDTLYRYGGDEFVVLLPNTGQTHAVDYALHINNIIHKTRLKVMKKCLSMSMGIATFGFEGIQNNKSLLKAADDALRSAKQKSKGSISVFNKQIESAVEQKIQPDVRKKLIKKRTVLRAKSLVPGLLAGQAFQYRDIMTRRLVVYDLEKDQLDSEVQRIFDALQKVDQDLDKMKQRVEKQIDVQQAAIFEVHRTILKDQALVCEIERELRDRMVNAELVVRDIFKRWEKKFKISESQQIREKADDIKDIGKRLLRVLLGIDCNALQKIPKNSIVFAARLLPSDTVHLDSEQVNGIVTQEAGHNSHVTILARALNVPLVSKVGSRMEQVPEGAPVVLDGQKGIVIIHPTAAEYESAVSYQKEENHKQASQAKIAASLRLSVDNEPIKVKANASSKDEAQLAKKINADGIGLFRMEQIYMSQQSLPTEEVLYDALNIALKPMKKKEITVRLLDIGADKTLPYIQMTEERNAALGTRGVRLLLQFQDLLEVQLRVLLRLSSEFKIRIMIPMVTIKQDVTAVKKILINEMNKLNQKKRIFDKNIALGTMIETPASVMGISEILPLVDFVSIGTNDLAQYLMVADRENANVLNYYGAGNQYILKWVKEIIEKADKVGKECEICGELSADLDYTAKFLKAGLRSFSVSPHLVPQLKIKIHELTNKQN